jgi:hypothetical protein
MANKNFADLMKAKDGLVNGQKLSGWMDVKDPASVAKYLEKIHKYDVFEKAGVGQLQNQLGIDFTTPTREWAVAQAISKASPQMLRLSIVGGLMGAVLPGNPLDRVSRLGLGFGLGSAAGVSYMARGSEAVGAKALSGLGYQALDFFAKGANTQAGKVTSNMVLHKLVGK